MNSTLRQVSTPKATLREVPSPSWNRFPLSRWAPLPLRLIVGYGFMAHGFAKLTKGPDAFATILHALGVPAPHLMAWATILIEVVGGLAIVLGAFVSLVSLPMAAVLLAAMFTVHLPYGFSSIKLMAVTPSGAKFGPPGYEVDLLYVACLATLVLFGPGPLAIDSIVRKRNKLDISHSWVARNHAAIEIRPAVPEDAEQIAHTFLESAEYHAELDPERYSTPTVETVSARYREGQQHLSHAGREVLTLVAELSGEIVGFIDARLEQSPDAMHREILYCHIAEIAVRGGHRNQGIGGRLLQAAEEWGHRLGAEFASLEYHAANTLAEAFYQERMGYRIASITAIRRL